MQRPLKIGTRGSPLALYQARLVQARLGEAEGIKTDDLDAALPICIYKTSGDRLTGKLSEFGGKGLFTKELEEGLLSGEIDLAVHSMKDVPTRHQPGLMIGAVLEREDPRDAFISLRAQSLEDLPKGALVGTASLRRRAQLAHIRPDIRFTLLRGNVGTRLEKLKNGSCDATFLAVSGLKRLGRAEVITQMIDPDVMLSAPAQGAIGVEIRADDDVADRISVLNHRPSALSVLAERSFLKKLDGSCKTPIAARVDMQGHVAHFRGEVVSTDGKMKISRDVEIITRDHDDFIALGYTMAEDILRELDGRAIWHD